MFGWSSLGAQMRWAYGALRRYWILGVLGLAASAATGYVGYLAEREFQIRRRARLLRKRANKVNIGSIFGMDVGGTLTKIVYFEKFTDADTCTYVDHEIGKVVSLHEYL